jgi:hypothetical protein
MRRSFPTCFRGIEGQRVLKIARPKDAVTKSVIILRRLSGVWVCASLLSR